MGTVLGSPVDDPAAPWAILISPGCRILHPRALVLLSVEIESLLVSSGIPFRPGTRRRWCRSVLIESAASKLNFRRIGFGGGVHSAGDRATAIAGSVRECESGWCGRRDLNPQGLPHGILSPARLPVPPLPRAFTESDRRSDRGIHSTRTARGNNLQGSRGSDGTRSRWPKENLVRPVGIEPTTR